jgi:hypothetical protein
MTEFVSQLASTDPGSAFGSNTLPDFNNIAGEWWFGGTEAQSIANAITGVDAAVIGDPLYSPGFANIGFIFGGGGREDGYSLDVGGGLNALSILMLYRYQAAGAAKLLGAPDGGGTNYNFFAPDATHISFGHGQTIGATDQAVLEIPDNTKFTLIMGVGVLNAPGRLYRITEADGVVFDDGGAPYAPAVRNNGPMQVGGQFNPGWAGAFDLAALAVIHEQKGSAFLEEIYPMYKAYATAAPRGIVLN